MPDCFDMGCNGCDECTDDDYDEDTRDRLEFGCCLPPGECCMPGLHFPSECHTAAVYEQQHGASWNAPRAAEQQGGEQ